jgi:hypothetical protein
MQKVHPFFICFLSNYFLSMFSNIHLCVEGTETLEVHDFISKACGGCDKQKI